MQSSDDSVVHAFLSGVREPARSQASAHLARGNAVLHPIPLFVTIKEIIEHADANGDRPVSDDELLAIFLSIATEAHEAAMPSQDAGFDQALAEMTVNRVAQASLLFPVPVELLATTTVSTWHREWSARTSSKSTRDLAEGPAAQWAEITGVELEDFLSLGWLFYNLWRHEGFSRIGADFFTAAAVRPAAVDFLLAHCSLTVDEFRILLSQDRKDDASLWTRYKLQQFPFVRLDDDTLLPIRFQFVIQRIFGDHLYLESEALLREHNSKKADHYAEAMRNIFEERVGEVLDRICSYDRSGETILVAEEQMKLAWRTSKSRIPKICDFALFRGHGCILVDANMRNLPQPFAEGAGTFESLQNEIDQRFATTKFRQLLSTVASS